MSDDTGNLRPIATTGLASSVAREETAADDESISRPPRNGHASAPPPIRDWRPAEENRYQLDGEHARGGIGRILRAHDRDLDRPVALKELLARDEQAEARFIREALVTARLQHPAIVPVYEAGRWKDGKPFYAMKMVSGRSLAELMKEKRTLDERLALLPHVIAVADAIAFAHEQHVIHRDLKPSNILIGPFGETVVVDWGLAADLAESNRSLDVAGPYQIAASGLTVAGTVLGTPEYMPLEQAEGKPVDARADVYAIGAILYHLLAGAPPYQGETSDEVLAKVTKEDPVPIRQRQPGVPHELATIVSKAMSRDARSRYPTAKELAEDLKRFQTGQLVSAHSYSRTALVRRWIRRYRVPVMLAAGFLLVLSLLGVASIKRIVRERNLARDSHEAAVRARIASEQARSLAETRRNEMILIQARTSLERDPTAAVAWLKEYPQETKSLNVIQDIAVDAQNRGIARHVLKTDITLASFSPDSKLIATGGEGKEVRVWDVETGIKLNSLSHEGWIHGVRFAPSGKEVLFFDRWGTGVYVWNIASGRVDFFRSNHGAITDAVFSPDGKLVVLASTDASVQIWSRADGRSRVLRGHGGVPYHLTFAPAGIRLASGGKGNAVRLWNVVTGASRILRSYGDTRALVFSPNGQQLALASLDSTVTLWNLSTNERQVYYANSKTIVWDVVFSPDGLILAFADHGGTIYLRDVKSGKSRSLSGHLGAIYSLAFSPDGRVLVSGGQDTTIRFWETSTGEVLGVFRGHESTIEQVAFAPNGSVVASVSSDKMTRLWPVPSNDFRVLRGHRDSVYDVALSPDGRNLVSGSRDRSVRLWSLSTGAARILRGHGDFVYRTIYSPDGQVIASASADRTVRLWNVNDGTSTVLNGHRNVVWDIAFSSDGRTLVSGDGDGVVRLWDLTSRSSRTLQNHTGEVRSVVFSPNGKFVASGGADREVRLYELSTGTSRIVARHRDLVYQLSFSPNGRLLASSSYDGTIGVWDVETGQGRTLHGHRDRVRTISFSPDGKWLGSGSDDHSVRIWSVISDECMLLLGHSAEIQQVIFSPDGRYLASASFDNTVRVWNVRTGSTHGIYRHGGYVRRIIFSADGGTLASASVDHTIRLSQVELLSAFGSNSRPLGNWLNSLTTLATSSDSMQFSP